MFASHLLAALVLGGGSSSAPVVTPLGTPALLPLVSVGCDARTRIASLPYTISSPGSYVVAGALTGASGSSGITVAADDVTIDLNGFTLSGVAGSAHGISGAGQGVTVFGGTLRGWGQDGIHLTGSRIRLQDLTLASNGGAGLAVAGSGVVERLVAESNGGDGVTLGTVSARSQFAISASLAVSNGGSGFKVTGTGAQFDTLVLESCTARTNGVDGFQVRETGSLRGCASMGNGNDGYSLVGSAATACTSDDNTGDGYEIFGAVVVDCSSSGNGESGFELIRLNHVRGCTAAQNLGTGILCSNERNLVDGNFLSLNGGFGVVSTDVRNTIVRNTAVDNTGGAYSAVGSRFGPLQSPSTATSPWANF